MAQVWVDDLKPKTLKVHIAEETSVSNRTPVAEAAQVVTGSVPGPASTNSEQLQKLFTDVGIVRKRACANVKDAQVLTRSLYVTLFSLH